MSSGVIFGLFLQLAPVAFELVRFSVW